MAQRSSHVQRGPITEPVGHARGDILLWVSICDIFGDSILMRVYTDA